MCLLPPKGNFKPGVYAVSVTGRLPPGTLHLTVLPQYVASHTYLESKHLFFSCLEFFPYWVLHFLFSPSLKVWWESWKAEEWSTNPETQQWRHKPDWFQFTLSDMPHQCSILLQHQQWDYIWLYLWCHMELPSNCSILCFVVIRNISMGALEEKRWMFFIILNDYKKIKVCFTRNVSSCHKTIYFWLICCKHSEFADSGTRMCTMEDHKAASSQSKHSITPCESQCSLFFSRSLTALGGRYTDQPQH